MLARKSGGAAGERRPRRMSAEDRTDLVLRRAAELFARKGFGGTTTAELAEAGGTSEAMLYKLFGSKKGLYAALIKRQIEATGDAIFPRQACSRRDDEEVFTIIAKELIGRSEAEPSFMRLLYFSALEGSELKDMFYEARVRKVISFLSDYIRDRAREMVFREVDPDLAAIAFLGMVNQFVLARQIFCIPEARRVSLDHAARTFVEVFLCGLRA